MAEPISYERGNLTPAELQAEVTAFSEASQQDPELQRAALDAGVPTQEIAKTAKELSVTEGKEGITGAEIPIIINGATLALRLWTDVIHPWIIKRKTRDALGKRLN
jgi:hypothetical protein